MANILFHGNHAVTYAFETAGTWYDCYRLQLNIFHEVNWLRQ